MAQRKQLTWTELRVGLFVLVGLTVLAVGIFYVTGATILGPKYRLNTFLPEVAGLAKGAPVRLDGVEVGNVEAIAITPRSPGQSFDKNKNIEVVMRIDKRFQKYILTDSAASLVTEGLLGNRYVAVTRGVTGVPLTDGQEVAGNKGRAITDVASSIQALSEDIRQVVEDAQAGKGTVGKLLTNDQAYNNLNSLLANGSKVVAQVQSGQGTLGKLVESDEMYNKAGAAMDNVNAILGDVRAQKGTIGKLLYDPSLYDEAKQALASTNGMVGDIRAGKGSLGKLATDDTLYNKLRDTSSNLAQATAKLNDNTTTAGKLFSDPRLYDNLTGLTGDLRLLIGDFRQNPKKFLHIKLSIF
jgi:phospholipid/cholesterol/gamma-HCH transport system substrate-binding protein